MAEKLEVDPVGLHLTSNHLCTAAEDHATGTIRHRNDFTDAVSRWRGAASLAALQEVADRWETVHAQRQEHVNTLGQQVANMANTFVVVADGSRESSEPVPPTGGNPGSGPDVGLRL